MQYSTGNKCTERIDMVGPATGFWVWVSCKVCGLNDDPTFSILPSFFVPLPSAG
jgi:hypothetical protein